MSGNDRLGIHRIKGCHSCPQEAYDLLGRHTQINRNTQTSFCQCKSIAFERSCIGILEKIMGTLNTKVRRVGVEFTLPELSTEQVPSHIQMKTRPRGKVSMKCWPQGHILNKPKEENT